MMIIVVLACSVLIQAAAAVMAFRLIDITGRRRAWLCISAALALMAIRRMVPLWSILSGQAVSPDLVNEIIGLMLSILMAAGIALLGPLFMERKRLEKKLVALAHYDSLTGIPNRTLFMEKARTGFSHAKRTGMSCAILFVDLDYFKGVNDAFGHVAGDDLLKDTAVKLSKCIRDTDVMARQGGDEFVIFLNDLKSGQDARYFAERIREQFSKPRMVSGNEVFVTTSVGIAVYPNDGESLEALLKHADTALYAAKRSGRNGFRFYDAEMHRDSLNRLQIERGLRDAVVKKDFELRFQPVVNVADGKIRGVEALLRWRKEDGSLAAPDTFMRIAETSGLIVPIGDWVMREACRINRRLVDQGYKENVMVVNISEVQLWHKDLVDVIARALQQSGLPAHLLEVEINEGISSESVGAAIEIFRAIRQLGVRISLDNFGSGSSSLAALRRFPAMDLKIDRLCVNDMGRYGQEDNIVPEIIRVAHKLKLSVTAVGVETEAQLEELAKCGCDYYQGFWFSPPVPEKELGEVMAERCGERHLLNQHG